jgi:WD40 repeat protein
MPAPLKPIIYIAFANDLENPERNLAALAQEKENIETAIRGGPETAGQQNRLAELLNSWDLIAQTNCTPRELTEPFYSNRVAIFHYGGHAGPEALLLETEDGANVAAASDRVIPFFRDQKSLKLIFLNGCSTKQWALDLAEGAAGAFCIIATSCPVQDPVAMKFAHDFYNGLAADATIEAAFQSAVDGVGVQLIGANRDFGKMEHQSNGLPWALYPPGPSAAKSWRLSSALRNPLLGIPALGAEYPIPSCPYVSIRGHQKEDAQIFFGRNAEIREIYDWATRETETPILLLYGQSGSGKSSLLRAGVWPRLEPRASIGYFRREEDLTDDLNLGLSFTTHIADPSQAASAWLRSETPVVILLDQIEEAITHRVSQKGTKSSANDELTKFFGRIFEIFIDPQTGQARVPGTKARLILSFRKEFLADIRNPIVDRIPALVRDLWLPRLTEQNIIDIIEGPVLRDELRRQYKIALAEKNDREKGFAEHLASRLYDPYSPVATILQLELNRLWDLWHPTDPQDQRALQDPNGLAQQELLACRQQKDPLGRDQSDAVVGYTRKLYDKVSTGDALRQFVLDQVLIFDDPALKKGLELDLLFEHTSGLGASQRRTLADLKKNYRHKIPDTDLDRLLARNKELHLLADVSEDPGGKIPSASNSSEPNATEEAATVLAHDTLAPVVRREFELSHNPGQSARRILEDRARGWDLTNKGDYLDAADLHIVGKGLRYMRATTGDEDRLLRASRIRHGRNMAFIFALVLVALVAAGVAFWREWQALNVMASMQLADAANLSVSEHYDLALLLSAAAYELHPTPEATNAVMTVVAAHPDVITTLYPQNPGLGVPLFSPDNSQLLITDDTSFELWDVAGRKRLWTVPNGIGNGVSDMYGAEAFSRPDGRQLALAVSNPLGASAIQLWQTSDHSPGVTLPAMKALSSLAYSNDGKYLAAAGCDAIEVWALSPDRPPALLSAQSLANPPCGWYPAVEIAFDPVDSGVLAVWSGTGEVWLENPIGGDSLRVFRPAGGNFVLRGEALAFSADGTRLGASTMTGGIDLFNVVDGSHIGTIHAAKDLTSIALSADGANLAAAAGDGSVGVWDTATQFPVKPLADGGSTATNITAFSPDLRTAAVQAQQGDVLLLDLTQSWGPRPATPARDSLVSLAASPDGKWIATGTVHGHVILWDTVSLKPVKSFSGPDDLVAAVAFTPDSKTLLFPNPGSDSSPQIALQRFDIANGSMLPDLTDTPINGETTINAVAAGQNGWIVALSDQSVLHLWNAAGQPAPITGVAGTGSDFVGLAISPDGTLLATPSATDNSIALLQLAAPRPAPLLLTADNQRWVQTVAFSPQAKGGAGLLAGGGTPGFWFWNLANRQQTNGGEDPTASLAFSPDGNLVLLGLANGQIELWNVAQNEIVGQPIETPQPDFDQLPFGVAFSPDGKRMYAGGWEGTFRVWDWSRLPLGDLAHHLSDWPALACSIANRNLTRDEWKRYVGSIVSYRPVCSFPQQ